MTAEKCRYNRFQAFTNRLGNASLFLGVHWTFLMSTNPEVQIQKYRPNAVLFFSGFLSFCFVVVVFALFCFCLFLVGLFSFIVIIIFFYFFFHLDQDV